MIRRIRFSNPDAGSYTVTLSIGTDGVTTRILEGVSVPSQGLDVWGPFNLAAAEIVQALASTTAKVVYELDGEETTA